MSVLQEIMTETGFTGRASNEACGRSRIRVLNSVKRVLNLINKVLNSVKRVLNLINKVLNSVKRVIKQSYSSQTAV